MKPKHDGPIEVHLEKTPSGTWGVPQSRRRPFRPWQRLWLVTGVVYLLMLIGSWYVLMPTRESIERRMVFSVTEEIKRYDGMAFAGESPRNIFVIARSQGYAAWIDQVRARHRIGREGDVGFDTIDKQYRESISDLPVKYTIGVFLCIVIWLVPMGVSYAAGSIFDWIQRGATSLRKQ